MKQFISRFLLLSLVVTAASAMVLPANSFAQIDGPPPADQTILGDATDGSPEQAVDGVVDLITRFTAWIYTILLSLAVVFILIAAYKYLTSGGGDGVQDAHKMILWAAIAVGVAFLSRGIIPLVQQLLSN